jgi:hypothetical protein
VGGVGHGPLEAHLDVLAASRLAVPVVDVEGEAVAQKRTDLGFDPVVHRSPGDVQVVALQLAAHLLRGREILKLHDVETQQLVEPGEVDGVVLDARQEDRRAVADDVRPDDADVRGAGGELLRRRRERSQIDLLDLELGPGAFRRGAFDFRRDERYPRAGGLWTNWTQSPERDFSLSMERKPLRGRASSEKASFSTTLTPAKER